MYHMQSTSDIESEIKKRGQNAPYLLCSGEVVAPEQLYLILDQQILCEVENNDAGFALLSAFFCFQCLLPERMQQSLLIFGTIMQFLILKTNLLLVLFTTCHPYLLLIELITLMLLFNIEFVTTELL